MTRPAQRFFILWLLAACIFPAPVRAAEGNIRELLPWYLQSIALVLTESGTGTAFAVQATPSGTLLITSSHVVEGADRVRLRIGEAKPVEARVIADDPEVDLALLEVDGLTLPPLPLASTDPVIGTDLAVVGYPLVERFQSAGLEVQPSLSKGVLSAIRRKDGGSILQVDVPVNPGNSGGPAFDWETGKVIGVVRARLRDASGINFLVGTNSIHTFLTERPTPKPTRALASDSIRELMDRSGIPYEINENGNFKMVRKLGNGRTQLVLIYGRSWEYNGIKIREIWAPAFRVDGDLSGDLANRLLKMSYEAKIGGWQTLKVEQDSVAIYAIKVVDRLTVEELRTWIDYVASYADTIELEVTGKDDY
ncbi:MAG: S1C family serine protease [Candidatus Xenobium sp.]|nr:trypsin-like peptidase domain-containing protein [Burkholderiales bacterium]